MADAQAEIAALRRKLEKKEARIKNLEAQLNESNADFSQKELLRIDNTLQSILQSLINGLPRTNTKKLNELEDIARDGDPSHKIASIVGYIQDDAIEVIDRLVAQLQGHVDFLTRLADTPDILSLFLVREGNGEVFLPDQTRILLCEQAARTSKFLAEFQQCSSEHLSHIDDILSLRIDYNARTEQISKLIQTVEFSEPELRALFLQEVLITSALCRYVSQPTAQCGEPSKGREVEAFRGLLEALDLPDCKFTSKRFVRLVNELTLNIIHAKTAAGVSTRELFSSVRPSEWVTWARHLYTGLTNLKPDGISDAGLRIVIEEAGMTAIGTQVLQKRLKSLRFQKSVMLPPDVPGREDRPHFAPILAIALSATRMLRAVGHMSRPLPLRLKKCLSDHCTA
jgi:hypothetical protein